MKKKTLLTAAAILAAMTMLAGCSNSETPNQSNQSGQSTQSSQSSESSAVSSDETSSVTTSSTETSSAESTASSSTESTGSTESTTFGATSEPETSDTEKPVTAADLKLADGEYTIGVTLEGGSGKVKAVSPTKLIIKDGAASAEVELTSSKYDYMKVGETKYDMINTEGNSKFLIPVSGFDYKMPISANTTAMGNPHEIEYTLFFDSKTIK